MSRSCHASTDLSLDVDPRKKRAKQRRATGKHCHHDERYLQAFHVGCDNAGQDFWCKMAPKLGRTYANDFSGVDARHILLQARDELICEQCFAGRDEDGATHRLEDC